MKRLLTQMLRQQVLRDLGLIAGAQLRAELAVELELVA